MTVKIPKAKEKRLESFEPGEIVYYPYAREGWLLLEVASRFTCMDQIHCEVLAEGPHHCHGVGRLIWLHKSIYVYPQTEMEVIAWAVSSA